MPFIQNVSKHKKMKIRLTLLTFTLVFIHNAFSQCDSITVQNVTNYSPFSLDSLVESDGLRNGPDYKGATMFFPVNAVSNLMSLVLVPGYQATQNSVIGWARYLASRGFVCMTIGTNSLNDSPATRANALIDGMETIRQENNRFSSPLYQKIDTSKIAVGGWSMGGGGAQLAATIDSRVRVVLAIAPWLSEITLSASDLDHNSPVLIISGQLDPIAPPADHSDVHFNYTPSSTHKLLFEISGGDHYTPLNPSTGNGDVGNVAYAWLKLFLESDNCYCEMLSVDSLDLNSTGSDYQTNLNCSTLSTSDGENTKLNLRVYPVPTANKIVVEFNALGVAEFMLYNAFGQRVKNGEINSGEEISIELLPSGIYYLKVGESILNLMKE
jgi:dienelactone hydrolase